MIPRTFPSTINTDTGKRQMVVYFITSISGLQRWKDYIPVAFVTDATPSEGSYNNDGFIAVDTLTSVTNKQAWKDYVPVFLDNSSTDVWRVSNVGVIPVGFSGLGSVPALFANGEQGAWYDPSDLNTLFQNQAGTTPVTAVEQPVSLMLDKSKGGGAIGADTVVNGTFAADSDWTKGTGWSIGSGVATKIVGTASLLSQSATLIVGRSYLITYTITRTAGTLTGQLTGGTAVSGTARSAAGTYTDMLTAVSGNNAIAFSADALFVGTVDNVTLRLLPAGNHAYTPSTATASRPVLSARVNLLEKTEQFDDAYWSTFNTTVTANTSATTDPLGGNTSEIITPTVANNFHLVPRAINSTGTVTFSVYAKTNGYNLWLQLGATDGSTAYFDLLNGTTSNNVTFPSTFGTGTTQVSKNIENVGNGWFRCTLVASRSTFDRVTFGIAVDSSTATYAGDGTSGIYIWGADLRVSNDGVGIPSYQRVNTSTDYDTVGFPRYLRCDGTDDYMQTNSINFTATDKMTVWAGVRKLSDAGSVMFELSDNINNNNGTFNCGVTATGIFIFSSKGTIRGNAEQPSNIAAPLTTTFTGIGNISGDSVILRLNGAQVASDTADQGTGNYGNYPLYLFRRGGTTIPFNGRCYSLIVRGAQSSTAEITSGESYVNTKTRGY